MKELDSRYRVAEAARRVNETTYSHVDGRDLLAELHPRHHMDIKVRRDGQDHHYEADWLSSLYAAVQALRAQLASYNPDNDERREREKHQPQPVVQLNPNSELQEQSE